jgi:hypothetical protein
VDPVGVLGLAGALGRVPQRVRIVVCEPLALAAPDEVRAELSPPVAAAIDGAVALVRALVAELGADGTHSTDGGAL